MQAAENRSPPTSTYAASPQTPFGSRTHRQPEMLLHQLASFAVPAHVLELVPESVARENAVLPLAFDGETITCAAAQPDNIALADRLRFILAKDISLVRADRDEIMAAITRNYANLTTTAPVDSMMQEFTDSAVTLAPAAAAKRAGVPTWGSAAEFRKGRTAPDDDVAASMYANVTNNMGAQGMFFYIVEEGQRVLMRRPNGTIEIIVGPRRVWRGRNVFLPMQHHVAHPNEYLVIRFRNGKQEHLPGPVDVWFDPREHLSIAKENGLQIGAKEAVVVYSKHEGSESISRRIVHGPGLFIPRPGEWLHTFSWHASKGGHLGVQKVPNALVFQKLWLIPDQMYHDVNDVRSADDAVLTVRLMIFFELADIDKMLDATHDPIGDLINAATSDVVTFTGQYAFEEFKRNTSRLNELEAYPQLTARAQQCGYRITKVVYRGYGAADALQQMHDQAIQARTRLQLDRATEQQAQDLENYKLESQLARAARRRTEQVAEIEHDLALTRKKQEAELRHLESRQASARESARLRAEMEQAIRAGQDTQQRQHLEALRNLGVDLTAYLTQGRADQVIELRGESRPHVHLEKRAIANGREAEK